MTEQKTAKPFVFYLMAAAFTAGVCLFCVLLNFSITRPKILDISKYNLSENNSFIYNCTITDNGSRYTFNGYAFFDNNTVHALDNYVVLHHSKTDTYLRLPTQDILNLQAIEASSKKSENYSQSGFYASINKSYLKYPLNEYKLCFTLYDVYEPVLVITEHSAEVNA